MCIRDSSIDDLMQLVGKLEQQSGNSDGSCRVAKQILDFFELHVGDYRMSQVPCTCMSVCMDMVQHSAQLLVRGRQSTLWCEICFRL